MKFLCTCGSVVFDNTDLLPYKGYVISDQDWFPTQNKIVEDIEAYIKAKASGSVQSWLAERFSQEYAQLNLPEKSILSDIVGGSLLKNNFSLYQCPACGRLHISSQQSNKELYVFVPQNEEVDIFKKP